MDENELITRFQPQGFNEPQSNTSKQVRGSALQLAQRLNDDVVDCREKSLAITALEEATMWANRAIAVGHKQRDRRGC